MKKRKFLSSVLSFALAAVIATGSPTVGIKLAKEARLSDEPTVQAVSKAERTVERAVAKALRQKRIRQKQLKSMQIISLGLKTRTIFFMNRMRRAYRLLRTLQPT